MKTAVLCLCFLTVTLLSAQMKTQQISVPADSKGQVIQQISNIWDVFKICRSVRAFTSDSIPEADILRIIDAARTAPTSGNQQPWKFLVIRDKNKINQMKEKCVELSLTRYNPTNPKKLTKEEYEKMVRNRLGNYFSAPVYIVVLTDNKYLYPDYNHWDGPLAAGYMMLAARALG